MELEYDETAKFDALHDAEVCKQLKAAMKGHFDLRGLRFHVIRETKDGYEALLETGSGFTRFEGLVKFREVPRRFRGPKLEVKSSERQLLR